MQAVSVLHEEYRLPHVLITSVRFPAASTSGAVPTLSVVGSTRTAGCKARPFRIEFPLLDCFFSGTGDMFAALVLARLREVVTGSNDLARRESWISEDEVQAVDLPLARAAELALASMQELLSKTKEKRDLAIESLEEDMEEGKKHVIRTRAAEIRLVRNLECLRQPDVKYRAEAMDFQS